MLHPIPILSPFFIPFLNYPLLTFFTGVHNVSCHFKVVFLADIEEPSITEALNSNILSATCCATLLMEDNVHFTSLEFFNQVAGLSYRGTYVI